VAECHPPTLPFLPPCHFTFATLPLYFCHLATLLARNPATPPLPYSPTPDVVWISNMNLFFLYECSKMLSLSVKTNKSIQCYNFVSSLKLFKSKNKILTKDGVGTSSAVTSNPCSTILTAIFMGLSVSEQKAKQKQKNAA
jgi:hypothetical protein